MTERIGYNPYFYSYPQYLSSNLGVNNRFSPNFRGDGVGVATPQLTVNYTTPPDTVQISAGNKINEASTQEKQKTGMSTGAKWALGILGTAAAAYGCVVGHRMINKPSIEKVAKNFSEIFRRDVSKDEAQKMVNNYKELLEIKDKEEFVKRMFDQIKKDYGWEGIDFTYKLNRTANIETGKNGNAIVGGFRPLGMVGKTLPNGDFIVDYFTPEIMEIALNRSKKDLFATIIHEFQHCKQHELAYRADKNKFIEAMLRKRLSPEMTEEITLFKDAINKYYAPIWDKLPALAKGSKEYELGLKYINEFEHYVGGLQDESKYMQQLVEKEARQAENKAKYIYSTLIN